MCKTVLYRFTVILGSARNIELLNDASMLFPVEISRKCHKSLRYSFGFFLFFRCSCCSGAVSIRCKEWNCKREDILLNISRMHPPPPTFFRFKCWYLELGSRFSNGGRDRSSSPLSSPQDLYLTRFVSTKHRKDVLLPHGPNYLRCCLKRGYSDSAECWIDIPFVFLRSYWWGCRKPALRRIFTIFKEYFS